MRRWSRGFVSACSWFRVGAWPKDSVLERGPRIPCWKAVPGSRMGNWSLGSALERAPCRTTAAHDRLPIGRLSRSSHQATRTPPDVDLVDASLRTTARGNPCSLQEGTRQAARCCRGRPQLRKAEPSSHLGRGPALALRRAIAKHKVGARNTNRRHRRGRRPSPVLIRHIRLERDADTGANLEIDGTNAWCHDRRPVLSRHVWLERRADAGANLEIDRTNPRRLNDGGPVNPCLAQHIQLLLYAFTILRRASSGGWGSSHTSHWRR